MQKLDLNIYFNGLCPECSLNGENVEMRLNKNDFFESIETGIQIYLIPGYLAVLLLERGKGNFMDSEKYATDFVTTELLVPQNKSEIPFVNNITFFKNSIELSEYILNKINKI
jgi:hypothetical protein